MPATTVVHADSATAVSDIAQNIYDFATGTDTSPSGKLMAFPTINDTTFTSTVNVIDSSKIPLQRVYIKGSFASQSWAFKTAAMMYAGFPIPAGFQPTDDSDGTVHLYDPDWKWIGRPTDTQYHGRVWELWGARSPEQNAADGLPAVWTAKFGGRLTGVNNRKTARSLTRNYNDAALKTYPSYSAPKSPVDTSANTEYWGYGPDGVGEESNYMTTAAHLVMSHTIIRKSDIEGGVIRHPIGFALHSMYPYSEGSKGSVWPATGYDSASRNWLKHGNRLRLPADYTPTYPPTMPESWRPLFDMVVTCMRDYGVILIDTTGNSFMMRGEPGISNYYPAGFVKKDFVQNLPWRDLQMIAVGSDTDFYPGAV